MDTDTDSPSARAATPGSRERRFRELFTAHHGTVLRFARRRTHPDRAEDIAAETFLVAWRRLDDVPTRVGETLPWLYAVARHCLLNADRAAGRQQALAVRIADGLPATTEIDVGALATLTDLAAAWRRLSATDQEVLALALWEDLPSPQAARVLGISPTAYRLRLSRARRTLRRLLEPTDPARGRSTEPDRACPDTPTFSGPALRAVPALQEHQR